MPELDIMLFGPLRVEHAGLPLIFGRRQTEALLAYLAAVDREYGRETLAALFWPDFDESRAQAALRRSLHDLGRTIGKEWLTVERERVALRPQTDLQVDVRRFSELLAQVASHGHSAGRLCDGCLAALAEAADIYRGDFLAGFTHRGSAEFDTWQSLTAENLRLELAGVLEKLATGLADRRQFDQAWPYARRWLALDPLDEAGHRLLMQLYAWAGDRTAVARQYEQCGKVLAAELGIKPAPETTALYRVLVHAAPTAIPASVPPLQNLPADVTPFIGREATRSQVAELLADPACRLLTILGPGGIGKTRLAIQAARDTIADFPHGVHFVDLAPLSSNEFLSSAILRSLDVSGRSVGEPDRHLLDFVRDKTLLLLLDNYEHLLGTGDPKQGDGSLLLSELLAAAPQLKLLVTSRARLNVTGEWLLPLEGLAVPPEAGHVSALRPDADEDAPDVEQGEGAAGETTAATLGDYGATALCLACIRRVRPGFRPSEADARAIERICRLVDGAPLAIELAAAWARALPLDEIARRLAAGLALLTTTLRDVPARQRSMTATFDYSWRLLPPTQQSILRQLAVFRDGFTAEAAATVTGAGLDGMAALADASWLRLGEAGRYAMHELVREYCAEKLECDHLVEAGESADQVRRRHATYYHAFLTAQRERFDRHKEAIAEVALESSNLLAAWNWALTDDDMPLVWGFSHGLEFLAVQRGLDPEIAYVLRTGIESLRAAAATELGRRDCSRERAAVLALVLGHRVAQLIELGRLDEAEESLLEAENCLGEGDAGDPQVAEVRLRLKSLRVRILFFRGDPEPYRALQREWLAERHEAHATIWPYAGDSALRLQLDEYKIAGHRAHEVDEDEEARRLFTAGRDLAAQSGHELHYADFSIDLAWLLYSAAEYKQAEQEARRVLSIGSAYDDINLIGGAYHVLGWIMFYSDQHDQARAFWRRGLALARRVSHPFMMAYCLRGLAYIELAQGNPTAARQRFEEGLAPAGQPMAVSSYDSLFGLIGLGRVALLEERPAEALARFRQVLHHSGGRGKVASEALAGTADALLQQGELVRPAELCSFLLNWPVTEPHIRKWVNPLLAQAEVRLSPEELGAAMARGHQLRLEEVVAQYVGEEGTVKAG